MLSTGTSNNTYRNSAESLIYVHDIYIYISVKGRGARGGVNEGGEREKGTRLREKKERGSKGSNYSVSTFSTVRHSFISGCQFAHNASKIEMNSSEKDNNENTLTYSQTTEIKNSNLCCCRSSRPVRKK